MIHFMRGLFRTKRNTCTVLQEKKSYRQESSYLRIDYKCMACGHTISFPEQQGFNYCYLCGGRVLSVYSKSLTWNPLSLRYDWEKES